MKILFNFIPIKKGGGQQVAISFINVLKDLPAYLSSTFVVTRGTEVEKLLSQLKSPGLTIIDDNYYSRFRFEKFKLKKLVKINQVDIIFTMFGPDLPKVGIPSVVGSAYSNLFFPEIDFWKGFTFRQRVLLKLIDKFRIKRTIQADGIVFENSSMMKRSKELFNYPTDQAIFVKPSIAKTIPTTSFSSQIKSICAEFPSHFKLLLLSTWQKNKNMDQIPFILRELYNRSVFDVTFIMTVSRDHPLSVELLEVAKNFGVEENILFTDSVKPSDVPYLYSKIDAVLLLSTLESFSNNIIESWTFKKPLLISNLEWAKAICNESAIYVDPFNPKHVANEIMQLKSMEDLYFKMVQKGLKEIESYPSPEEKVLEQIAFVESIYNKYINKKKSERYA
jgi:glycosyltransferase involved in cell wall biosynthesis